MHSSPTPLCLPTHTPITHHTHSRLVGYLDSGRAVVGGGYDREAKWVEPTILVDVKEDSKIMQEEIFGPILPILLVDTHSQAIDLIRSK